MRLPLALLWFPVSVAAVAQVEVRVHLYNSANLSQYVLTQATQVANRAFAVAGISVQWHVCEPSCDENSGPPRYIVGIAGPNVQPRSSGALGFAMLEAGDGDRAVVSLPRLELFANSTGLALPVAMGHAIAHELGHLITRSARHSYGIMSARWDLAGVARMQQDSLRFAAEDVEKMQKNLKARHPSVRLASSNRPEL